MFGFEFTPEAGLLGLFISSFISATFLPGGSELVLLAVLHHDADLLVPAVAVATTGNTLGGMTAYGIGRLLPNKFRNKVDSKALVRVEKYGYAILLFSWLPLIGDPLCVAAGWLRMNWWKAMLVLAIGKLMRYLIIAGGFNWLQNFF